MVGAPESKANQDRISNTLVLEDLVVENDYGGRRPKGLTQVILLTTAFLWSVVQLWIVSPFPERYGFLLLNTDTINQVHLGFALFLAILSYPAFMRSPRGYIPLVDWLFSVIGVISVAYLIVYSDALVQRTGMINQTDIIIACMGIGLLLEATRRCLGLPLAAMSVLCLIYIFFGQYAPDLISHKGHSLARTASHMWFTSEGIFGLALSTSAATVFLFVLFSALLEKGGAGYYFIQLSIALLGHMRGGPAKAAVIASAIHGMISGSSVANAVGCGVFTIPIMRKVGFSRERAGAVEAASSVNGQLMPPVMGAAAFLMSEYLSMPYTEIIKHAFLPAIISYISLFFIVHIESVKKNMPLLTKRNQMPWVLYWLVLATNIAGLVIFSKVVGWGVEFIQHRYPQDSMWILLGMLIVAYVGMIAFESRYELLESEDPNNPSTILPDFWDVFKRGMHYFVPLTVMVWLLLSDNVQPEEAAFWSCLCMIMVLITQKPLRQLCIRGNVWMALKQGVNDFFNGMINGARNMVVIGVATGIAGIIVGTVSLTGIGQKLTEIVEILSAGSIFWLLVYTAFISIFLGMGLPTTATYVVVATLIVPVVSDLCVQSGFMIPAIAIHLFVFYFGMLADVTPPVGLASFAAAAVSGGEPTRTGWIAFVYSLRTVILPFIFVYDTQLLLIGVDGIVDQVLVFGRTVLAMLFFAAASFNFFIVKNKIWESLLLYVITFMLAVPNVALDFVFPAQTRKLAYELEDVLETMPEGTPVKLFVKTETEPGHFKSRVIDMNILHDDDKAKRQIREFGLVLAKKSGDWLVKDVDFDSPAEKKGFEAGQFISGISIPNKQPSVVWVYLVAIILAAGIVVAQRGRQFNIIKTS